jgi:hypothetical protein
MRISADIRCQWVSAFVRVERMKTMERPEYSEIANNVLKHVSATFLEQVNNTCLECCLNETSLLNVFPKRFRSVYKTCFAISPCSGLSIDSHLQHQGYSHSGTSIFVASADCPNPHRGRPPAGTPLGGPGLGFGSLSGNQRPSHGCRFPASVAWVSTHATLSTRQTTRTETAAARCSTRNLRKTSRSGLKLR